MSTKCVCGMDQKYCIICIRCGEYWCNIKYCKKTPLVLTKSGYHCVTCIKDAELIFPYNKFVPLVELILLAEANNDTSLLNELHNCKLL